VGCVWAMIVSLFVTFFAVDLFYGPVRKNTRAMLLAIVTPWRVSLK
jgi:hypothetical protein